MKIYEVRIEIRGDYGIEGSERRGFFLSRESAERKVAELNEVNSFDFGKAYINEYEAEE